MAAPTGLRDPVTRDGKDKGTLISAGRLMSRRVDREVEALQLTVAKLKEELATAREQGSAETVKQALARTDGGLAAKTMRKEISELQAKVEALERERSEPTTRPPPPPSAASTALDRLTDELAVSQQHRTSLEKQVVELERRVMQAKDEAKLRGPGAGEGLAAAEREGLKEEVRIAQYEVVMLAQEKTKLAAQLKLERAQRKQVEDDAEREGKRLLDRLTTSTQRIQTLEAELSRARAVANGVKSDKRHVEAQLKAKDEACEMRIEELTRETAAELADVHERLAEVTEELERKRASTMPRLKELEAARARVEAQSKELARLNGLIAAHKVEQGVRKKRKGAPRTEPVKQGAAIAVDPPSTSASSESGWAQVDPAAVVELERQVVTLRAEKALAIDQAELKISKLEQLVVGAGLAALLSDAQDSLEPQHPSASSALLAEVAALLASCERRVDSTASGLVQLKADIALLA
ncbi:hypothetical protein JCM9279_003238 [Rhodotorula babjevae]